MLVIIKRAEYTHTHTKVIPAATTDHNEVITYARGILHGEAKGAELGATVAKNNSGELCGIQEACEIAHNKLQPGDSLTICTPTLQSACDAS